MEGMIVNSLVGKKEKSSNAWNNPHVEDGF